MSEVNVQVRTKAVNKIHTQTEQCFSNSANVIASCKQNRSNAVEIGLNAQVNSSYRIHRYSLVKSQVKATGKLKLMSRFV